ncbi:MAG: O-methyltransferase [Patescibacteria group bacterium]|nr:O-methyltransferase [Patescibacteria group bacterium]
MLPTDGPQIVNFNGNLIELPQRIYNTVINSSNIKSHTEEFSLILTDRHSIEYMSSNPINLRLLSLLIQISKSRSILEIGAFIGVSSMTMARALPEDGHLWSVEKTPEFARICRENFRNNNLSNKISLIEGDGLEVIKEFIPHSFDFIFLDGDKEHYAQYFKILDNLLMPNGLLIADDAFFNGDVLNEIPSTQKGRGVSNFLSIARVVKGYDKLLLPIGNGMMIMRKSA